MIWCTTQLDALQQSPLYHLSLGSKELFHSNFLAWAFCEFGDSAFDAIQNHFGLQLGRVADPRKNVSREHLNLDLAVEFDNGLLLVIENKVKSLPDRSQLERYGAKVKKKRPQGRVLFVLLSAMDPSFDLTSLDEGDTTWSHWSYRDISKIMREVVRTTKSGSPYTRALLADYADFAETLDGLCKRTAETTQADFLKLLTPETANELTGARIHDLVYKLAFQHLTLELDQKLTIHGHLPTPSKGKWQDCANRDIWTGTNFTNSQGLCDVKILLRGSDNPLALGVQLQHRSLRLVLESTKDGNLEPTALRVLQSGFWFDFSPGLHGVGSIEYPTRGAEDFNRFGNKFLYRSRNLRHKGKEVMTCSEIADVLLRFIEHGYTYRERIAEVCFGN